MLLSLGAVFALFPFAWMITTAFKTYAEAASGKLQFFPEHWQFQNFLFVFRAVPGFERYFFNSFLVAFTVSACVIFTSLMAGYALGRLHFPGRDVVFGLIMATMMVPFEVILIPNYFLVSRMGLYDTYAALIIPWCANGFSIFLMRQAFRTLPSDFFDAATLDGCGHLRFLVLIATPLLKPMVITVGVFAFLGSYNALVWPILVTASEKHVVIQLALTRFTGEEGVKLHLLMCAATIVILPTVALYFLAQRHFMENAFEAGIKG